MTKINYEDMIRILRIQKYKEIATYDSVIDHGIDSIWKNICSQVNDPDIDPTDVFSEEAETLQNTKYSMQLMSICCLSETWEQDLYNYLKEKGLIKNFSNDYAKTKQIFESNYPKCIIANYPLITEMRALVNAIKHGEGNSLSNIRRLTSDQILADSNLGIEDENGKVTKIKQIEFDQNTLTSKTLNVSGKLQLYSDALVKFWEDVFASEKEKHATFSKE